MTDLRTVLGDIADDAPDHDEIRRRLQQPKRTLTPALAAVGVVVVLSVTAGTALLTHQRSASRADAGTSVTGGATATQVTPTAADHPWMASCFGAADVSTDLRVDVGMGQKADAINTAPRAEDYFDICGSHWRDGTWVTEPQISTDGSVLPRPEDLQLTGCVLPDGTYGIFPGPLSVCADLGLPPAIAPDPSADVIESPRPTS